MSELTTNHDERDQMVSDQVDRSGCNSKEECPACHESSVDVNVHQSDKMMRYTFALSKKFVLTAVTLIIVNHNILKPYWAHLALWGMVRPLFYQNLGEKHYGYSRFSTAQRCVV